MSTPSVSSLLAQLAALAGRIITQPWQELAGRVIAAVSEDLTTLAATVAGLASPPFDLADMATAGSSIGLGYPGILGVYRIPIGNASGDYSVTIPAGITVAFVAGWFQKTGGAGGAGDTYALKFAGTNVTVDGNVADNAIVPVASFDDTWSSSGPGDTITVTATKVTNTSGWFTVLVMKA